MGRQKVAFDSRYHNKIYASKGFFFLLDISALSDHPSASVAEGPAKAGSVTGRVDGDMAGSPSSLTFS